ncbi:MAG: hypothetical protein ACI845_000924 [Gammaproteobacteria bacterium]|jgi:hypothetical protein
MNFRFLNNKLLAITGAALLGFSMSVFAVDNETSGTNYDDAALGGGLWNGWSSFSNDSGIRSNRGGQAFDTEYLYYKYDAVNQNMSIGLQTGFDVVDGHQRITYSNGHKHHFYGGDLALSFDGIAGINNSSSYEYAVDFGLETRDWSGHHEGPNSTDNDGLVDVGSGTGVDNAGLYNVSQWNENTLNDASPFAMDVGMFEKGLTSNDSGSGWVDGEKSFFRTVTFNLAGIVNTALDFTVDAHWTMSCGNDQINGNYNVAGYTPPNGVPEPSAFALFAIGSMGMGFVGFRRRKIKS